MFNSKTFLMTGGSGLLGGEIRTLLPEGFYPSSSEFNVTDYDQMNRYLEGKKIETLLHAAAFTSPPKVDQNPVLGIEANIIGTGLVTKLCFERGIRLVYVCTDYVFKGDHGHYSEEDPVLPVNKYAWSKLGGECAVRMYDNSLIIRTSFGPNVFPYEKAFIDQWTSRESVRAIAQKIAALIQKGTNGVVHVGGPRRTVYEYATGLDSRKAIGRMSIKEVSFNPPVDTSLNCTKYENLLKS